MQVFKRAAGQNGEEFDQTTAAFDITTPLFGDTTDLPAGPTEGSDQDNSEQGQPLAQPGEPNPPTDQPNPDANAKTRAKFYGADPIGFRFFKRRNHLDEFCGKLLNDNYTVYERYENNQITQSASAGGNLRWCPVPKAAGTYLRTLTGLRTNHTNEPEDPSREEVKKFVFTRDPYNRMIATYYEKMISLPLWWKNYGVFIKNKFRQVEGKPAKKYTCGNNVTFSEFVKFFLYTEKTGQFQNEYLVPVFRMCDVCNVYYDYLAHTETLEDDVKYIYEQVGESGHIYMDIELQKIKSVTSMFDQYYTSLKQEKCSSLYEARKGIWKTLQYMGILPLTHGFYVPEEKANKMSSDDFLKHIMTTYEAEKKKGTFDKAKQKDGFVKKLFAEVSFDDRLALKEVLRREFEFFGYPLLPKKIFPEFEASL